MDFSKTHVTLKTSTCVPADTSVQSERENKVNHMEVRIEIWSGEMRTSLHRFSESGAEYGTCKVFVTGNDSYNIFQCMKDMSCFCKPFGVSFEEVLEIIIEVKDRFHKLIE